jgi:hypothetical protein
MTGPPPRLNRVGRVLSTSLAGTLGVVAAVRRAKPVHPHGVVYDARLDIPGAGDAPAGARLLSERTSHRALVRFSRSIGLPRPLPDLLGMSIRVLDAYGRGEHQDLMLISSIDRPLLHHIFVPVRDVWQAPFSSSLPYRAGADAFLIGALPRLIGPRPDGSDEFARTDAASASGRLSFDLAVASLEGRFRPVGVLRLGGRLPPALDALGFNPWNTGGGLEPAGWLNATRYAAYRSSQTAWGCTQAGGEQRQQAAEDVLAWLAEFPSLCAPRPVR